MYVASPIFPLLALRMRRVCGLPFLGRGCGRRDARARGRKWRVVGGVLSRFFVRLFVGRDDEGSGMLISDGWMDGWVDSGVRRFG